MIPVTKPFLPPEKDYQQYLTGIWQRNWLTNDGPLVNELERQLKDYLKLKHIHYVTNGTIGLQLAIRALSLKGEIITTPFSYVATTSAIVWEGCLPVFVDIKPETLNIDPNLIEAAITPQTSAILATHLYGNPCDTDAIADIARKHGIKVIYDAAHAFGTRLNGRSIYDCGDISTASFHATKLFHTVEGGAVITSDPEVLKRIVYLRNFGHSGPEKFNGIGINGKNSEFHAAMGLALLPYMEVILARRREQWLYYRKQLQSIDARTIAVHQSTDYNQAYFPLIFPDETTTLRSMRNLEKQNISTRRYFYPPLHTLSYISGQYDLPVTRNTAPCVLCLPLYHELSRKEMDRIIEILLKTQSKGR